MKRDAQPRTARATARTLAAGVLLAALLCAVRAHADSPSPALPDDPAVRTGTLENALRYAVAPGDDDAEGVSVRLVIDAGPLRENDGERGVADLAVRMVFGGSARFSPDAQRELLEAFGPGGAADTYILFDSAFIALDMPRDDEKALRTALRLCADALSSLTFPEASLARERTALRARWDAFNSAPMRAQREIFRSIDVGSTLGDRFPMAPEGAVERLTRDQVVAFHSRWYTTSGAMLVVAGGRDADAIIKMIRQELGAIEARATEPAAPTRITPLAKSIGLVVTDPELNECDIDLLRLTPVTGPATTERAMRSELLRSLALRVLTRRLDAAAFSGAATFDNARAYSADIAREFRMHSVFVSGHAEAWREMLADLVAELRRTAATGVSTVEIDHARSELLAEQRQAMAAERLATPPSRAASLARAMAAGRPLMNESQRLALTERLLAGVGPEEVVASLSEMLDPERAAFVVSIPSAVRTPTPDEVLDAATRQVGPLFVGDKAPGVDRPELPAPSGDGRVAEMTLHPDGGVLCAWLSNGVRAHHREMEDPLGLVHIAITLTGGRIEETEQTRGLTDAASVALTRPATGDVSSLAFRDLLAGASVTLSGRVSDDSLGLTISAQPQDVELALRATLALLSGARIEPRAFEAWRRARTRDAIDRQTRPYASLRSIVPTLLFDSDEPRVRPLSADEVAALRIEDAQAWLDRLLATAPIEVGVTGAIGRREAMEMVTAHLGSLAARERVSPEAVRRHTSLRRAPGGSQTEVVLDSTSSQGLALIGFAAAEAGSEEDIAMLDAAGVVLRARLKRLAQGRPEFVYTPQSVHSQAGSAAGVGMFYAVAATTDTHLDEVRQLLEREFASFLSHGPTEAEMEAARAEGLRQAQERLASASVWAKELSLLSVTGRTPDVLLQGEERVAALTASQVHECLRELSSRHGLLRLAVRSQRTPADPR